MTEGIFVDPSVTHAIRDEFKRLATELDAVEQPLRNQAEAVREGAGELGAELADGVGAFELSWRAALQASSETAAAIGANVGQLTLDLQALDEELSLLDLWPF